MEIVSRTIFIDTQYLMENSFNFYTEEFKSLEELSKAGYVKVYMTDITEEEIKNNIKISVDKGFEKIKVSDARVLKSIPAFREFLKEYEGKKATDILLEAFLRFKTNCKISILSTGDIKMADVYKRYADKTPPFSKDSKKNEFPDAFALLAILNWSYREESHAYLLSGDHDWVEFSKTSWEYNPGPWDFRPKIPRLHHVRELSEFLNLVYETESKLKDLALFWNELIVKRREEIETLFLKYEWADEWLVDAEVEDDVDLLHVYQVGSKILEKEIIKVEREMAVYNITADVTILAEFEYTDYNEKEYDYPKGVQRKVKVHKVTMPVTFECSFACPEGLEVNFQLTDVDGGPVYLIVPYDWDNILNFKEWTKNFEVILQGVKDGEVTESGEGVQHFDSYEEAKKVFPSLKLIDDSKDFYVSRESETPIWVSGPLQYFTGAALDQMYGPGPDLDGDSTVLA